MGTTSTIAVPPPFVDCEIESMIGPRIARNIAPATTRNTTTTSTATRLPDVAPGLVRASSARYAVTSCLVTGDPSAA